ncbi:MAG TPA: secondary thiamine-phosphate synthase enzyme YjbQ [Bryobacteraceae bacterium]|nr:secondary thiamine-phosphate synthase enzyme YjbQ [Bryobacteraceae bacterium]
MRQTTHAVQVQTRGKGLYEITGQVTGWTRDQRIQTGLLTAFVQHTSASLTIQENADPDVIRDLEEFFARLVPENARWYRHTLEGPDDMPAHIRSALTQTSLSIPIHRGRLALGTWQGIYLFEHRDMPHNRSVILHILGQDEGQTP